MRRYLFTFIILATCLAISFSQISNASTTVNYDSPCQYFNSNGKLQASTNCKINFGTLGASGGARFIVTFPSGSQVTVYKYVDGQTTANGIRSEMAAAGGNVVVATHEGEIFIFKSYQRR